VVDVLYNGLMLTILFVCTANRYRSPIAEACFKWQLAKHADCGKWEVLSAGTWAEDGLPPILDAIVDAKRLNLNIQGHRSRMITKELMESSSLILVMEHGQKEALRQEFPTHREKILLLSEVARDIPYDIPDPVMDPSVGDVAGEICKLIKEGFEKILERASK
jgi:protein-tyrosine phosphatase